MTITSDLSIIGTVVKVPDHNHPIGIDSVAEEGLVTSLGAVANVVSSASGRRMTSLPINPPKSLKAFGRA
jgi:CO/xanthine dehydrogenase Mo-binding subunit